MRGAVMPSDRSLCLYEVGVRISQALIAFPPNETIYCENPMSLAFRFVVMDRLRRDVQRLQNLGLRPTLITNADFENLIEIWPTISSRDSEFIEIEVPVLLHGWSDSLCSRVTSNEQLSQTERDWFQLGRTIVKGSGSPESDVPPRHGQPGWTRRSATWDWEDEDLRRELINRLDDVSPDVLFCEYSQLTDIDREGLPGLPDCYWGWWAIEAGIQQIRSQIMLFAVRISERTAIVTLRGDQFAVTPEQGLILRLLHEHGDWMSSAVMKDREPLLPVRIDRCISGLPEQLGPLIESRGRRGYRLCLERI